jgi:putative drug exporter of the RND superfamily
MGGLTRFVLRQRWPVVAAWVAVVLVSALASSDLLTNRFTLPSTDTRRAEVILVSRMREEWDNAATNEEAVVLGLTKTGRLVTSAGLIMFAALTGFVAGSVVGLQQFGFGLAAAILIDVTIVRALLVPSEMKLFGKWNWWLPDGVARILRVEPSPPGHRPPTLQPSGQ